MNKPITSTEIETTRKRKKRRRRKKKLPTNKSPGQDEFTGKFHQTFTEELVIPILLKLFPKIAGKGILRVFL